MRYEDRHIALPSGGQGVLRPKPLPLLPRYHVFFLADADGPPSTQQEKELFHLAPQVAEELGLRFFGDRGCFTLLFSGARTRRRPWPHVHMLPVRSLAEKRRALLLLYFKRVLGWAQRATRVSA